ncbi:MAG: molybdopterin cofactor-binding domain-containing protein, partial [Bryobacteraceae bacterium]
MEASVHLPNAENGTMEGISRRGILKSAAIAGAALVIAFDVPQKARGANEKAPLNPLRSWIRIDTHGEVTILSGRSEMGQGISTALPMVLAEELGVDWKNVKVVQAPTDSAVFGNQGTGGSGSVAESFTPLRQAGAAARLMFISAAAQRWNVVPEKCQLKNGVVSYEGQSLGFADLVDSAAKLPIPDLVKVPLKKPAEWEIIGQPVPRKDIPSKTDGSAQFGLDVRIPGMA